MRNGFNKENLKKEIINLLKQIENKNPHNVKIYSQDGLLEDFIWYWYFSLDNLDELLIALIRCYKSRLDLDGINFDKIFDKVYKNFEKLENQEIKGLFYPLTGDNRIWYFKDYEPDCPCLEDSLKEEIGLNENQIENIINKAWLKFNYDNFYNWLKQEYELKEIFKELIEEPYEYLYYINIFFDNLVYQEIERG